MGEKREMKKLIALVITVVMLFTVYGVLAEEGQITPLYATVGEAMGDDAEGRVIAGGVPGDYYAVVTKKEGKYYRSVAFCDEKLNELNEALESLDYEADDFFEKHDAAMQAVDDYIKNAADRLQRRIHSRAPDRRGNGVDGRENAVSADRGRLRDRGKWHGIR